MSARTGRGRRGVCSGSALRSANRLEDIASAAFEFAGGAAERADDLAGLLDPDSPLVSGRAVLCCATADPATQSITTAAFNTARFIVLSFAQICLLDRFTPRFQHPAHTDR